jgi:hypothetical protein
MYKLKKASAASAKARIASQEPEAKGDKKPETKDKQNDESAAESGAFSLVHGKSFDKRCLCWSGVNGKRDGESRRFHALGKVWNVSWLDGQAACDPLPRFGADFFFDPLASICGLWREQPDRTVVFKLNVWGGHFGPFWS